MSNKTIRTDAPDTVVGVQRRAASIDRASESYDSKFQDLTLDTLVGIAEAGKEGCREPDDPVEVAREVMRVGADLYDDPDAWLTFDPAQTEQGEGEES